MAFPTSPTNGQQANINGITYTYSSALTAWTVSTSVSNTFVSINVSANVNSGNVLATGLASVTGNITGGNLSGTNIVGTLTTAAQTNITSVGTLGSLTVTANTTSGNLLTGGLISATGNITGGNILGGANVNATTHTGTTVLVTANVTGGNILTGGLISSTGNIAGGNVIATTGLTAGTLSLTGNTISSTDSIITIDPASAGSSGAVFIQGNLSVTGNVTYINSNNVTTNDLTINMANNAVTAAAANGGGIEVGPAGAQYASITYNSTGNIWVVSNGANVSGAASVTGNVTGGNILTGGLISAAGNISANNATFTSNQTLSYGTANGVAYLNGSKVLTTGSALTFDGTNLGIGTTTVAGGCKLNVLGGINSTNGGLNVAGNGGFYNSANKFGVDNNAGATRMYSSGANSSTRGSFEFHITDSVGTLDTTAMVLDAGGNLTLGDAAAATNRVFNINGVVNKAQRIAFQESSVSKWLIGNGAASENGNFEIYDNTNGKNYVFTRTGVFALPGASASANGVGITFPATQSASTDANTLDDYEEGTWTPSLRDGGTDRSPTYQFGPSGTYIKIGKMVFIRWGFKLTGKGAGAASGEIQIYGLPFPPANTGPYQEENVSVACGILATAANAARARMVASTSSYIFGRLADNADTAWLYNDLTDTSFIIGEMTYITTA